MRKFDQTLSPEDVIKQVDRIEGDSKRVWEVVFRQVQTPYLKRDMVALKQELDQARAGCHPFAQQGLLNFHEAEGRLIVMKTKLLEAEYATALSLHKRDKGRYPQALPELVPAYFQALPADPFSDADFRYLCAPDGSRYGIYSVGPDKTDDRAAIRYDQKSGTISPGDIFY
jgi:hypothetical protein